MLENSTVEEEITDEEPEPILTAKTVGNILADAANLIELAVNKDPIMTRSLPFKHDIEKAIGFYKSLYKDLIRRAKQTSLSQNFSRK